MYMLSCYIVHPPQTKPVPSSTVARPSALNLTTQSLELEYYEHFMYQFSQLKECMGSSFGSDLSSFTEEKLIYSKKGLKKVIIPDNCCIGVANRNTRTRAKIVQEKNCG